MAAPVSVRMDQELLARLEQEAAADERTRAQIIRLAVRSYLDEQQARRATQPATAPTKAAAS